MNGYCSLIMPCLKTGRIAKICGLEEVAANPNIITFSTAYNAGEEVLEHKNVKQRFGEFVVITDDKETLISVVRWLFEKLHVLDADGKEMLIERFDTNRILQ